MVWQWTDLKMFYYSYLYIQMRPMMLFKDEFLNQAVYLKKEYDKLIEKYGENMKYAKLLGHEGTEVEVSNFPDIAYSTVHYMKLTADSWKNFATPKQDTKIPKIKLNEMSATFISSEADFPVALSESQTTKIQDLGMDPEALERFLEEEAEDREAEKRRTRRRNQRARP